jgi:hypothetical protein
VLAILIVTVHKLLIQKDKEKKVRQKVAHYFRCSLYSDTENRCLAIMRLESGSMDELIDLFLKISRPVTVPKGTVVLFGSLTSLAKVGLQSYASACINGKRHISGAIKESVPVPLN